MLPIISCSGKQSQLFTELILCDTENETDPIMRLDKKYSKHPSILRTTKSFKHPSEFCFVPVDKDIKAKKVISLDPKKAISQDDIPGKLLKSLSSLE